MTVSPAGVSIETLTLPHEDPLEHRLLLDEWLTAYPCCSPIERGFLDQAVGALIEMRRIARVRAALRTDKVRTAVLFWERTQEDNVQRHLLHFNVHPPTALVGLLRSAAGCRWALAYWRKLQVAPGRRWHLVWRGPDRGHSASGGLGLHPGSLPVGAGLHHLARLPGDPAQSQEKRDRPDSRRVVRARCAAGAGRAALAGRPGGEPRRLQALVDREIPRLEALEADLRVKYEEPSRAAAQDMELAEVTPREMQLLRSQRLHEQSYQQAVAGLLKAASRPPRRGPAAAAPQRDETALITRPRVTAAAAPEPTVGRSEQRSMSGGARPARSSSAHRGWTRSSTFAAAGRDRAARPATRPQEGALQGLEKPEIKRTRGAASRCRDRW